MTQHQIRLDQSQSLSRLVKYLTTQTYMGAFLCLDFGSNNSIKN